MGRQPCDFGRYRTVKLRDGKYPGKPAPTKPYHRLPRALHFPLHMIPPLLPSLLQSLFPSKATPLCPDAKPPPFSVRKFAVSTSATRSPSFKLTSGSKSASGSAKGYTSASGSESATTGPGLGIRIRTRLSLGNGNDNGSTSCATSVRVGLLRTPNALAGSKVTSAPSPKSLPVSSTRSSPPPPFERLSSERDTLLRFSVVVSEASKFPCPR